MHGVTPFSEYDLPTNEGRGEHVQPKAASLARRILRDPFSRTGLPSVLAEALTTLSPESSRELGPFHFSRAPYLIDPQKAILDPDVREVVLNWSSQCGKSELWLNALLYWSVNAPAPALVVAPDWKSCKSLSSDRIKPMARDAHLGWDYERTREAQQLGGPGADNSAFRITLNGKMPLTIVHASSASALAQRPVKYLLFDEVSRMPVMAKGRAKEGDPIALGLIRTTTYSDEYKAIYVSSPVELEQCRITELYENSSREKWHSPCPGCGHLQSPASHLYDVGNSGGRSFILDHQSALCWMLLRDLSSNSLRSLISLRRFSL
jgi:phage terminase large subunit GpA-like protein